MEQYSLFSIPQEKGAAEWGTFEAVRETKPGAFRVASSPLQPQRNSVVAVRRYRTPHQLFPRPAH